MALTNSLVVLFIAVLLHILTKKLLQQCFLFFIVVVIPGHNLGNSQVSVYRTIGPTLVTNCESERNKRLTEVKAKYNRGEYSRKEFVQLMAFKTVK